MTTPGYMRASALAPIVGGGGMLAAKPSALMYERLDREGVRQGHAVGVSGPGGAYRSYDDLVDIQRQWLGKSHKRDWKLLPGSGAMPSLYSIHGLGRCFDFTGDVDWIKQVSLDYGLTFPLVHLGDWNHGQHDGKTRGAVDIYPYEIKRMAVYLQKRTGLAIGAAKTGDRGGPLHNTHWWKALRQVVAEDGRQGKSLRDHHSHYLDLEAKAKAA